MEEVKIEQEQGIEQDKEQEIEQNQGEEMEQNQEEEMEQNQEEEIEQDKEEEQEQNNKEFKEKYEEKKKKNQSEEKVRRPYNVVILGNIESEESSLLHKFIKKRLFIKQLKEINENGQNGEEDNRSNASEKMNSVEILGETKKLKIWDQASANKLFSPTNKMLKFARGIILFYSVAERKSFNMLKLILNNLRDYIQYDFPMVMVGNDSETPDRQVNYEEAKSLADSYGLKFYETNIKYDMSDIFEDLGNQINYHEYGDNNNPDNVKNKIKNFFRHSLTRYKSNKKPSTKSIISKNKK